MRQHPNIYHFVLFMHIHARILYKYSYSIYVFYLLIFKNEFSLLDGLIILP
jgi:hypothetical protein